MVDGPGWQEDKVSMFLTWAPVEIEDHRRY